jgi:hypothetical protein
MRTEGVSVTLLLHAGEGLPLTELGQLLAGAAVDAAIAVQQLRVGACAVVRVWFRIGGVEGPAVSPVAPAEPIGSFSDALKAAWKEAVAKPLEEPLVPVGEAMSVATGLAALASWHPRFSEGYFRTFEQGRADPERMTTHADALDEVLSAFVGEASTFEGIVAALDQVPLWWVVERGVPLGEAREIPRGNAMYWRCLL